MPKEYQKRGTQLLNEIEKRSPELTFDSKGTIYIDGDALPNSNFFIFFPLLFKKRVPKALSGFPDFVNKLNSMRLNHLFPFTKTYKNKINIDKSLQNELSTAKGNKEKAWWLLV